MHMYNSFALKTVILKPLINIKTQLHFLDATVNRHMQDLLDIDY